MKKVINLFMAFVMLLSVTSGLTLTAYAGTTVSGTSKENISWEYDSSTKTMTFSGSGILYFDTGGDYCGLPLPWQSYVKDDDIERIVVSDGITYVNFSSFYGCINIKETYLGQDVKEIESVNWRNFKYFEKINIDKNNVYMTSIDGVVYNKNKTMLIYYPCGRENSEYIIPDGVKSIEANCFSYSTNLKNISIPNSVKTIGSGAFYDTGIINLEIPDSVNLIEGAFNSCKNLKTVKIGNNVTKIETFQRCEKLESIEFGNSIEYIGGYYGENLKTIVLPKSLKQIGFNTFKDCHNLKDVYYSGNEKDWDKIQIGSGNYGLFTAQIHYNSSPSKQPDVNPTPGGSTGGGSSEITPTPGGSTGGGSISGGGSFAPAPTPNDTDKKDDDKKPETTPSLPATSSLTNKPTAVTANKPEAKKNSLVATWKPMNNVNGYEVQVATDKKFKKNKKSVIINKKNAKKKTIKNLKKNKKYFVRVRAYKIVDGKKVYGKWSKIKSVKAK